MATNDAEKLAKVLRDSASAAGSYIVESHVRTETPSPIVEVLLDSDAAAELIVAKHPSVLYLYEHSFDLEEELEELKELYAGENALNLNQIVMHLQSHQGELCLTSGHFVIDSILHTVIRMADWYEEFGDLVDRITAESLEAARDGRRTQDKEKSKHIEGLAQQLVAHPSFNFGRVSFEKRLTLACEIFIDEERNLLREVVERAESIFWLQQSGFTPENH